MCGIFGTVNKEIPLDRTKQYLSHRGPDAQTIWESENVQFHHFRLSILDIESGHQPMHFENLVITFNGEIYNHLEVRNLLNLDCKTDSDTETILHAFKKLGPKCLPHFDGMFAFAIYDKSENKIFIARDRAGVKPLFYYKKNNEFVFSSELNVLNSTVELDIDKDKIRSSLIIGIDNGLTPYKYVEELRGGQYLCLDCDTMQIEIDTWWKIDDFYKLPKSNLDFEEAKNKTLSYLELGVKRRIDSSDLEVGSFLSGGIDSGLVTYFASKRNHKLKTFTISFPGVFDEAPLAKIVADNLRTDHKEIRINFDQLNNDFESIVFNYGRTVYDSSAIPSYYVSKAAKDHLTVILNGDGADELFGGYRRYIPFSKYDFFSSNDLIKNLAVAGKKILPEPKNKKSFYNYLHRLITLASHERSNRYWSATVDNFVGYEDNFFSKQSPNYQFVNNYLTDESDLSGLEKVMNLDFNIILFSVLLPKMDIATMANSLEGRSPFLCKELLEFTPTLPDQFKISGKKTKHILRSIARDVLPKEIYNQPKRGFEIPLVEWVDTIFKERIHDYLKSRDSLWRDFIKEDFVYRIIDRNINMSNERRAKILYKLLVLEIWNKMRKN